MNKVPSIVFLLLASFSFADAPSPERVPAPPSVFLDSDPIGARINLDGRLLVDRTPALLRGLSPGKHSVSVGKQDFIQVTQSFEVASGQVPVVRLVLPPDSVVVAFPENAEVVDAQGKHSTSSQQFRYPAGTYVLSDQDGAVRFTPVFPEEGLLTVAGWSLAALSGAALLSTASDIYHISAGWVDHPSLLTAGLWVSTLFSLPWWDALQKRKTAFMKDSASLATALPSPLELPQPLFDAGEDAMNSGDLAKAEGLFTRVVREHPSSQLVPGAWFRLARIHLVTGRRELALGEYRLVAETYPQAAYYDRAREALANLYEAAGERALALENLDQMVLTDGFFDRADIEAQKARLKAAQEAPVAP